MKPLAVIPTYLKTGMDLDVVNTCLESLRETAGDDLDVLVVDDGSPDPELVEALRGRSSQLGFELRAKERNSGFSRTVNVGLRQAKKEGRDAILVNADIEFVDKGWVRLMQGRTREDGEGLASVVGGRLIYPSGLIQHGGIYFSILHRCFEHIHKYAPHDLPEALTPKTVPVTGALQFIRYECLEEVGVYDEGFLLGWEDVDYCVRAWLSGRACVYEPNVRAYHHESFFRSNPSPKVSDWTKRSWQYFTMKYADQSFAEFVPSVI